jgi:tRNA-binding EMAP/Myf-like protein
MPTYIMECIKVNTHPNADLLKIYEFIYNKIIYQIICNPTNIYAVGDKAAVALIGSVLKNDTEIKESKIRGIISQGMALGKSDLPVGTNVTNDYCHSEDIRLTGENPQLVRWASIENLYNIRKEISEYDSLRKIKYRAKIKLHGSNCACSIFQNGDVVTQSREQIITPEKDNAGFSRWVNDQKEYWSNLKTDTHMIVFGEWVGPGVNKGCAIHELEKKVFCVFAIQYNRPQGSFLEINPITISETLGKNNKEVFVIPFYGPVLTLNFFNTEDLKIQAETINAMVAEVEKEDPYVKAQFGIGGVGEGLVFYCLPDNFDENNSMLIPRLEFSNLGFKAKGDEHKVVKTKAAAQIDPEVANSISEYITLVCTENRLKQQAEKVGEFSPRSTGQFLKAFCQDVCKESVAELEAAGMKWENVSKHVSEHARKWWLNECNKL